MAFGSLEQDEDGAMAEINMVPLIDVMLVLLLVFMITAPMMTHSVEVRLPRASSAPVQSENEKVELAIDAQGRLWWNQEEIGRDEMKRRMQAVTQGRTETDVRLRAERTTEYERIAQVMSDAASVGLRRIGLVTQPGTDRPTAGTTTATGSAPNPAQPLTKAEVKLKAGTM